MSTVAQTRVEPFRTGLVQLGISVVLLSSAFPATKMAVLQGAAPGWFALGRAGFSGLTACAVLAALGRLRLPVRRDLPAILAVGGLQIGAFFALSHAALAYVPAGRTSILANSTTVWIAPLTVLVLRERVPPQRWIAAALGVVGTLVLVGPWSIDWAAPGVVFGHALLLAAALGFALALTIMRRAPPRTRMLELLPWCFALGAVILGALAVLEGGGPGRWTEPVWLATAYLGLVAGPFGTLCIMLASRALPAMVSSIGFLATPAVGLVLATLLLHETLGPDLVAGSLLIFAGVALAAWPERGWPGRGRAGA